MRIRPDSVRQALLAARGLAKPRFPHAWHLRSFLIHRPSHQRRVHRLLDKTPSYTELSRGTLRVSSVQLTWRQSPRAAGPPATSAASPPPCLVVQRWSSQAVQLRPQLDGPPAQAMSRVWPDRRAAPALRRTAPARTSQSAPRTHQEDRPPRALSGPRTAPAAWRDR